MPHICHSLMSFHARRAPRCDPQMIPASGPAVHSVSCC